MYLLVMSIKMKNAILNIYSMPSSKRENFGKFFRTYVEKKSFYRKTINKIRKLLFSNNKTF